MNEGSRREKIARRDHGLDGLDIALGFDPVPLLNEDSNSNPEIPQLHKNNSSPNFVSFQSKDRRKTEMQAKSQSAASMAFTEFTYD